MTPTERAALNADLAHLAEGDRSAFDSVFTRVWPVVHRFTLHFLGGAADAEDAAQLALLKVFERVESYDRQRDALSWVLAIAAWECRTVRRRHSRRREVAWEALEDPAASTIPGGLAADDAGASASPEVALERKRLQAALDEALDRLAPTERALLFGELCGPTVLDLGLDGVRPAALRKRKQRALARLRAAFGLRVSEP